MSKKRKHNQKPEEEEFKKKNFMITEEHLMDKTHMETTQYLPYLPNDSLYPNFQYSEDAVRILRTIVKDLNYLLYLNFKNFWATLLYNPTLKICIQSCLKSFHCRWMNEYINKQSIPDEKIPQRLVQNYDKIKFTTQFQYQQGLMKVILLIFWRITHSSQENAELSNLYHIKTEIINKYILDFPRILQIIEIYGESNEQIVRMIVKQFVGLSPTLYTDFKEEVIEPLVSRMSKNYGLIKKITDREQFGIEYHYKRTVQTELSPGEQQLRRKITLLMQIISFYNTIENIYKFFPSSWGECTKFNLEIHNVSENLFIEIEQGYRIWNNHDKGDKIYVYMNKILKSIVQYFVEFLEICDVMFVQKKSNSNFKEAYMKCFDRMIQNYGRRQTLGKKAASSKRYMELYRQIQKIFPIDEFTSKLYADEIENETYKINMDYFIDFKIAIDEEIVRMEGRPAVEHHDDNLEDQTQADVDEDNEEELNEMNNEAMQVRQFMERKKSQDMAVSVKTDEQQFDKLEMLISRKGRDDDYYEKLYKEHKTKIAFEYQDQYDDFADFEKRPMFKDDQKSESSDASSQDFDQQKEKLKLVKSESNVNREKIQGSHNEKYDRKNKVKFVPVREAQAKAILNREQNKNKGSKVKGYVGKVNKEYQDEQCNMECKAKIKTQKPVYVGKNNNDSDEDEEQGRGQGGRGRGRGRGGYGGQKDKAKGGNTNKPKYVSKN